MTNKQGKNKYVKITGKENSRILGETSALDKTFEKIADYSENSSKNNSEHSLSTKRLRERGSTDKKANQ